VEWNSLKAMVCSVPASPKRIVSVRARPNPAHDANATACRVITVRASNGRRREKAAGKRINHPKRQARGSASKPQPTAGTNEGKRQFTALVDRSGGKVRTQCGVR